MRMIFVGLLQECTVLQGGGKGKTNGKSWEQLKAFGVIHGVWLATLI